MALTIRAGTFVFCSTRPVLESMRRMAPEAVMTNKEPSRSATIPLAWPKAHRRWVDSEPAKPLRGSIQAGPLSVPKKTRSTFAGTMAQMDAEGSPCWSPHPSQFP